jgi:hypothetical protein
MWIWVLDQDPSFSQNMNAMTYKECYKYIIGMDQTVYELLIS